MIRATILALLLCCGAVQADELQDRAIMGQSADVVSTAIALTAVDSIKEGNPLGVVVLPLKIGLLAYADKLEDPAERADVHRALSATGWGPAVNNLCAISVALTGGGSTAACLALGIAAGIVDWNLTAGMRAKAIADTQCERDPGQCPQAVSYLNDIYVN